MFNRLKTLTLMQLNNRKGKRSKVKMNTLVGVLLRVLVTVLITLALWFILDFLRKGAILPIDSNLLIFILFITQFISILACIGGLTKSLYLSKDNYIIFTMPASPTEIFISKLGVYYISEFFKSLFFTIPFFFAFGMVLKLSVGYFIAVVFIAFILPLLAVLIGSVLSVPYMYFKKLLKRFAAAKVLTAMTIAGAVMYILWYLVSIIPRPLRILALYGAFIDGLKGFIAGANNYSLFYSNIVDMMSGVNFWANFGIFMAVLIGAALLTVGITKFYFKLASGGNETSSVKRKAKENKVIKNSFFTFVKKEFLINVRNIESLIGHFIFIVAMPFGMFLLNEVFEAIDVSQVGVTIIVAVNILVGLLLLTASNTMSANAITSEGSEFGLIKTAPANTSNMCYAKIFINLMFSLLSIISTVIMLAIVTDLAAGYIWTIFLVFLFVNTAHIFWSLQIDLLNPRLSDYAATGNLHDNPNIGKSIIYGLLISAIFTVISYFFINEAGLDEIIKIILIAAVYFVIRIILFILNMKVYFKQIQM